MPYWTSQFLSDQLIALAYFSIPVWLGSSARARRLASKANGQTWVLILFTAFIFSCGFGHEIDAYFEWRGICSTLSQLKATWNWITAILSIGTAITVVPRTIDYMMAVTSPVDINKLQRKMHELELRLADKLPGKDGA